jgi:hypothetical protein
MMGDIRHVQVRSPWGQGHIERTIGEIHADFEARWDAYLGKDPKHREEIENRIIQTPRLWYKCMPLALFNERFQEWVVEEWHTHEMSRTRFSPNDLWQHYAPSFVKTVRAGWLRNVSLLDGGTRKVGLSSTVQIHGAVYYHADLGQYGGMELEVRVDPADINRVQVLRPKDTMSPEQDQVLCWARRQKVRDVDSPKDLAELQADRKRNRDAGRATTQAIDHLSGLPDDKRRKATERLVERIEGEAEQKGGLIPFPVRPEVVEPKPPQEGEGGMTDEELLDALTAHLGDRTLPDSSSPEDAPQ